MYAFSYAGNFLLDIDVKECFIGFAKDYKYEYEYSTESDQQDMEP
jgi:hypothetical protein